MTATIKGVLRNTHGEPQTNIAVKLLHEPTGSTFARHSDASGEYQFESIRVGGPYLLSVIPEGGTPVERSRINLKTGEVMTQDFAL